VILSKEKAGDKKDKPAVRKEDIMERSASEFEAVVAIAKEARRLNAVPGVYLDQNEKPIPRAVKNFVDGKVEYEVEGGAKDKRAKKSGKKSK
jgi:DNA-directed RNA polymerase subunit K/omega